MADPVIEQAIANIWEIAEQFRAHNAETSNDPYVDDAIEILQLLAYERGKLSRNEPVEVRLMPHQISYLARLIARDLWDHTAEVAAALNSESG